MSIIESNEDRAEIGAVAVMEGAERTNVHEGDTAEYAIRDVLAYIAHFCDAAGLDPEAVFASGLDSYRGDFEDFPRVPKHFDGEVETLSSVGTVGWRK